MSVALNLPTTRLQQSQAFFAALGFGLAADRACDADHRRQFDALDQPVYLVYAAGGLRLTLYPHVAFYHSIRHKLTGAWYKRIHDGHHSLSHVTILDAPDHASVDARCEQAVRHGRGGRLDVLPPASSPSHYTRYVEDLDGRLWGLCAAVTPHLTMAELPQPEPVELDNAPGQPPALGLSPQSPYAPHLLQPSRSRATSSVSATSPRLGYPSSTASSPQPSHTSSPHPSFASPMVVQPALHSRPSSNSVEYAPRWA